MIRAPNALAMPTTGQPQQVYYDQSGNWQWYPYATGGATRPDSFTGMTGDFRTGLERMFAEAPPEIRDNLQVYSGYRSPERQAELWESALQRYGSEAEARRWVAPPGRSQHNMGNAADLRYNSPEARAWAHANAANYGLAFPLSNEDWHIELATARGNAPRGNNQPPMPGQPGQQQQQPQLPPTLNALAVPDEERIAQMQAAQRQQALNALTESLRRPIYTNVMQG
jgi:hypothetical protein